MAQTAPASICGGFVVQHAVQQVHTNRNDGVGAYVCLTLSIVWLVGLRFRRTSYRSFVISSIIHYGHYATMTQ